MSVALLLSYPAAADGLYALHVMVAMSPNGFAAAAAHCLYDAPAVPRAAAHMVAGCYAAEHRNDLDHMLGCQADLADDVEAAGAPAAAPVAAPAPAPAAPAAAAAAHPPAAAG